MEPDVGLSSPVTWGHHGAMSQHHGKRQAALSAPDLSICTPGHHCDHPTTRRMSLLVLSVPLATMGARPRRNQPVGGRTCVVAAGGGEALPATELVCFFS